MIADKKTVFKAPAAAKDDREERRDREHLRYSLATTERMESDAAYVDALVKSLQAALPNWTPPTR